MGSVVDISLSGGCKGSRRGAVSSPAPDLATDYLWDEVTRAPNPMVS